MLAHIRNGQIIKRYSEPKGWVALENGGYASPPVAGFVNGNDRVVEIQEVTEDQSTGDNKVTTSETVVTADSCTITRTIRDKTAQEISAEQDALILSESDVILGKAIFQLVNEVRALKSQQPITKAQFLTYLKGLL